MHPGIAKYITEHPLEIGVAAIGLLAILTIGTVTVNNWFNTVHAKDIAYIRWLKSQNPKNKTS